MSSNVTKFTERKGVLSEAALHNNIQNGLWSGFRGKWTPLQQWANEESVTLPSVSMRIIDHSSSSSSWRLPGTSSASSTDWDNNLKILRPYEGVAVTRKSSQNPAHVDFLANCGGPIWATQFSPALFDHIDPSQSFTASRKTYATQHLAVGLSRIGFPTPEELLQIGFVNTGGMMVHGIGTDNVYVVGAKAKYSNLLELWALDSPDPDLRGSNNGSFETSLRLNYLLEMKHRGQVWALQWNRDVAAALPYSQVPDPTLSPSSRAQQLGMGVLAAVCGDGSCLILALPKNPPTNISGEPLVLSEESARLLELRGSETTSILSISWVYSLGAEPSSISTSSLVRAVGGLTDGSVVLWSFTISRGNQQGCR